MSINADHRRYLRTMMLSKSSATRPEADDGELQHLRKPLEWPLSSSAVWADAALRRHTLSSPDLEALSLSSTHLYCRCL